jgi:glycine cleavage system protein P-like pyridoxal-binding family
VIRVRDRLLLLGDKCRSSSWCLLHSAVKLVTFSYKIMQARGLKMNYSVVVVVIANYIAHSLENMWSSSVIEMRVVHVCVSNKQDPWIDVSVRMSGNVKEKRKKFKPRSEVNDL